MHASTSCRNSQNLRILCCKHPKKNHHLQTIRSFNLAKRIIVLKLSSLDNFRDINLPIQLYDRCQMVNGSFNLLMREREQLELTRMVCKRFQYYQLLVFVKNENITKIQKYLGCKDSDIKCKENNFKGNYLFFLFKVKTIFTFPIYRHMAQ